MLKASFDVTNADDDVTTDADDVTKLNEVKNQLQSSLLKMTHTLEENLLYYKMSLLIVAIFIFLLVIISGSMLPLIFILDLVQSDIVLMALSYSKGSLALRALCALSY